jgi:hypothetical protein
VPWALVIRWVVRVLASLFVWRLATARRGAFGARRTPAASRAQMTRRAAGIAVREGASLGWHSFALGVLAVATVLLVSGGLTTTLLSPRWLGGVLLGGAVIMAIGAVLEGRALARLVAERRRRRHDQELRRLLS